MAAAPMDSMAAVPADSMDAAMANSMDAAPDSMNVCHGKKFQLTSARQVVSRDMQAESRAPSQKQTLLTSISGSCKTKAPAKT